MSTDIIRLAHSIRPVLLDQGIALPLGKTQQLLAAAFGYNSLAALQAAQEPDELNSSMKLLFDEEQFGRRAAKLNLAMDIGIFLSSLTVVSRKARGPQICASLDDLADDVCELVQEAASEDDQVGIQMADTNCAGAFTATMETASVPAGPLPPAGQAIVLEFSGTVEGDGDQDRPFSGDTVNVRAEARLPLIGRRLFGEPEISIVDANLDWSWAIDENSDDEPTYTKAQALAIELQISHKDAQSIEDAEITGHTTMSDTPNGYLVNLSHCERSEVVDRLVDRHGSLDVWVLGTSFDHMVLDDE